MMNNKSEHNMADLPKEGSKEVGKFFWQKWEEAVSEKERLGIPERMLKNYALFRGDHWQGRKKTAADKITANLLFANIERTVANITAKSPMAEVVDLYGEIDEAAEALSAQVRKWSNESEAASILSLSVKVMEIYGITVEKAVYNSRTEKTDIVLVDGFAFAPAPGYFEELNDCPYLTHAYPMSVPEVEAMFGVKGVVEGEEGLRVLGKEERENSAPISSGTRAGTQNYPGNYSSSQHPVREGVSADCPALVVEIWVRDWSLEKFKQIDPTTGEELIIERLKYPGGIRVVTLTNGGNLVLSDIPNPNINSELPREATATTFLYDHFPFYKANSYEDSTSLWGFSASEQVGDINIKINEILTRLSAYLSRVTLPPLIVPQDSGITLSQINNKPGLVLQPVSTATSNGIRYLSVPNLPHNFFDALQWYITLFDRISQIEDADRGEAPTGVIAAQAIVALQERGAVMMRAKIRSVDYLVRQRGRCAISNFQNFGQSITTVEVQGDTIPIEGLSFLGREFNYVVESGSTVAKTTLQTQEQAMALYEAGAIDRRALLETLNFPGWKQIVERAGEGQVDQALQILIAAGLQEEDAVNLRQYLIQSQGGPGDSQQNQPTRAKQKMSTNNQPNSAETRPPVARQRV